MPFFERIEQGEQRMHRSGAFEKRNNNHDNNRNHGRRGSSCGCGSNRQQQGRGGNCGRGGGYNNSSTGSSNSNSGTSSNKYCSFHRTNTHNTQDCRALRHDSQQQEHQQVDHDVRRQGAQYGRGRGSGGRRQPQTRVEQRSQHTGSSSDEEYMFLGLNNPPTAAPPHGDYDQARA